MSDARTGSNLPRYHGGRVEPQAAALYAAGQETVVERLRHALAEAGLDCGCQAAANEMLQRIDAEEDLVHRAAGLADARRMRDAIVLAIGLLGELDELMPDEPDRTAFQEIAGLFQDIADFAACGAGAALQAAGRERA